MWYDNTGLIKELTYSIAFFYSHSLSATIFTVSGWQNMKMSIGMDIFLIDEKNQNTI
jgi:hypothetical protein